MFLLSWVYGIRCELGLESDGRSQLDHEKANLLFQWKLGKSQKAHPSGLVGLRNKTKVRCLSVSSIDQLSLQNWAWASAQNTSFLGALLVPPPLVQAELPKPERIPCSKAKLVAKFRPGAERQALGTLLMDSYGANLGFQNADRAILDSGDKDHSLGIKRDKLQKRWIPEDLWSRYTW